MWVQLLQLEVAMVFSMTGHILQELVAQLVQAAVVSNMVLLPLQPQVLVQNYPGWFLVISNHDSDKQRSMLACPLDIDTTLTELLLPALLVPLTSTTNPIPLHTLHSITDPTFHLVQGQ